MIDIGWWKFEFEKRSFVPLSGECLGNYELKILIVNIMNLENILDGQKLDR